MRTRLAVAVAATLALTACSSGSGNDSSDGADKGSDKGSEKVDAQQLVKDAAEAMEGLETVHIAGTFTDDTEDKFTIDATVSTSGDCQGTMGIDGKGSFELIAIDGVSYFKPDMKFWTSQAGEAGAQIAQMVGDKWVTDSTDPEGFAELCDLNNLLEEMDSAEDTVKDEDLEGEGEVDGVKTTKIGFTSDDDNQGHIHIAQDDPHYILKMEVDKEGSMSFTDFNKELKVTKPAPGEIFDLGTL